MELLVIAAGSTLGYLLSNNERPSFQRDVIVSPHDQPSGDGIIYDSNRVRQVRQDEQNLAIPKYAERMKRTFPADYNKKQQVFPGDGNLDDTNANVTGMFSKGSAQDNFLQSLNQTLQKNVNQAAFDPSNSQYARNQATKLVIPAKNGLKYQDPNQYQEPNGNISLLSGKPVQWTHTNMQPYFGKSKNQVSSNNDNALTVLERFTGVPSVENQGTYSQKREVSNPFPNNPENPFKSSISQLKNRYDRAVTAVGNYGFHDYQTPVKPTRDLPFNKDIRTLPKNIDQSRSLGNQKIIYQGVTTGGQKGSTRAMASLIPAPKKASMFHQSKTEDYTPNRSVTTVARDLNIPEVRNVARTSIYENDYVGPSTPFYKKNGSENQASNINPNKVTRRMDSYQDPIGAATSAVKGIFQPGGFQLKEGYKGNSVPLLLGHSETNGSYVMTTDIPRGTIKDVTSVNTVGQINRSGPKDNTGYQQQLESIDLDATLNEMLSENKYAGQPHYDYGNGVRKQTYDPFVTVKETLLSDNSGKGTAKSAVPKHMSYDTVYETGKDTKLTKWTAPRRDPGTKPVADQIITQNDYNAATTDYTGNFTGFKKDLHREQFNNSVNNTFNPVNFGGIVQNGKQGNGDDSKRLQAHLQKEDSTVNGRFNPSLRHDNEGSRLQFSAELANEMPTIGEKLITKKISSNTLFIPKTVLKENTSSENSRLDNGLRITNDLFPWIKK